MKNLLEISHPMPKGGIYGFQTMDGHGGMAMEHRMEMIGIARQIAEETVKELVPKMAQEIYRQSLNDIIRGIKYDVETIVNIAFDEGHNILTSSKTRQTVSNAIYNEIIKGLDDLELKINF